MPKPFYDSVRQVNQEYSHLSDAELRSLLEKQYGKDAVEAKIKFFMNQMKPDSLTEAIKKPAKQKYMDNTENIVADAYKAWGAKQPTFDAKAYQARLAQERAADEARKLAEANAMKNKPIVAKESETSMWDTAAKYLPTPGQEEWTPSGSGVSPYSKVGDAVLEAIKRKKEAAAGYSTQQGY